MTGNIPNNAVKRNAKIEGGLRTINVTKSTKPELPLISIITVVFNGEQFIAKAIDSVVNQTYSNVEFIVIDGGSSDGTLAAIKTYEDKIDYWLSEPDNGIYHAMNKGISNATGDIIGIVNSDDLLYPDTCKRVAETFMANPGVAYTYGSVDLIREDGRPCGQFEPIAESEFTSAIYSRMPFPHPSLFLLRRVYQEIGVFNTSYKISADYDFTIRLIRANYNGVKIEGPISVFRLGGMSSGMRAFRENPNMLRNHGVSFSKRYWAYFSSVGKVFLSKVLPQPVIDFYRNSRKRIRRYLVD